MKKKNIELNAPLLALLMILLVITGNILIKANSDDFLIIIIIVNIISITIFFLCLYAVIYCWYCIGEILASKCWICDKKLANRVREAINFLLTPPWRKRKVKFICRGCEKNKEKRGN